MKILLCHNFLRSSAPSGEDAAYRNERSLLESNGHKVYVFERFNDQIDESTLMKRLRLGLDTAWSQESYRDLSNLIRKTQPDIVHFHNTFPMISPSAYFACRDNKVPVVQTLHNYRLICPNGLLLRNNRPCEDCVGTSLIPALQHRCYRKSLPATSAITWMLLRHRWQDTYRLLVNRYIALTEFSAGRYIKGGFQKEQIDVKPNFLMHDPKRGQGKGNYVVYVGRLAEEKGVRTLLTSWQSMSDLPLKILGDGPLRNSMEELAKKNNLAVEFLGYCTQEMIHKVVGESQCLIIPSEWYEGFPMVLLEAYACGTPVVSSRIGSLDSIVKEGESGVKFEPGNPIDLAKKVKQLTADKHRLSRMRDGAYSLYQRYYTAEHNYSKLIDIYHRTIETFHNTTST
ncbi:MAG: glycosyltransferase family 4 protein [Nitrospirales bacterium]|nr:glycosyltransferase family 4 protein [Nitrospira sp.]MDR4502047.1 glycosyltransferase family 4 protein [Nitrospirales bacterium]